MLPACWWAGKNLAADGATHSAGRGPGVQLVAARTSRAGHCQLPLLDSAPPAGAELGLAGAEPDAAASGR